MYGLRYGTPPVVRRTGGLADSVNDTTPESLENGSATGFVFDTADVDHLMVAIQRALASYRNKAEWRNIQRNGMARDVGWDGSARAYLEVYQSLL
jgi:starch synthase